jgi:hypothetical protein
MEYKPFKMKASGYGNSPMKKNFPSVFKNVDGKVNVFGGKGTVNTNTQAGKDILKEIKSIPTVSSSEPSRITKVAKKFAKGVGKVASKALMGGIINPFSSEDPRVTKQLSKANTKKINYNKTY